MHHIIAIDYSGAQQPDSRLPGLSVYEHGPDLARATPVLPRDRRRWSRRGIYEHLLATLANATSPYLVGIDHAFGLPLPFYDKNRIKSYSDFLTFITEEWPRLATHTVDEALTDHPIDDEVATAFTLESLRLCDRWTSSASSVYRLNGQGAVGKSTFAGLPWIARLKAELGSGLHLWPFDGWSPPESKHILCEIYPSLYKRRYPHPGDEASSHDWDAYATATWLAELQRRDLLTRYFEPPLTNAEKERAQLEGWILGVS